MYVFELSLVICCCWILPCKGDWWLEEFTDTPEPVPVTTPPTLATRSLEKSTPNAEEIVCCECVPFYQCINDTIVTDGVGIINVRFGPTNSAPVINVEMCPGLEICCAPPDVHPSCRERTDDKYGPVLHPDTPCGCVLYNQCDTALVVSDGSGNTSIQLSNGRIVSHSQCTHSLDVCCEVPVSEVDPCVCVEFFLCDSDGFIVTDGRGSIDLRFGAPTTVIKSPKICESNSSLVCCHHRPDESSVTPILPPVTPVTSPWPITPTPPSTHSPPDNFQNCVCIEDVYCGSDGYVTEEIPGLIDVRHGGSSGRHFPSYGGSGDPDYPSYGGSADPDYPSYGGPRDQHFSRCPHNEALACCKVRNQTDIDARGKTKRPPCGVRNSVGIGTRIFGFLEGQTQFGEFPWVVIVLELRETSVGTYPLFLGGASLIHPRVVLTAAHKVAKFAAANVQVRLGEWDTNSEKETHAHQDVLIEKIVIHPRFNSRTLFHDFALLFLKEEARNDFHIRPICLASSVQEVDYSSCVTNGWGVDDLLKGDYQQIMKSVELPLVSNTNCQRMLRKTRLSKHFKLHESFLCAGGEEGTDACKGDGGGPLACRMKGDPFRYLQVGITAWGIGCGTKDVPGVYANVPQHYHWIQDNIQQYLPDYPLSTPFDEVLIN